MPLRVAIIGAGIGGLTCARTLQYVSRTKDPKLEVQVTIYELEPSPLARTQGGTLDLRADTGQLALKAAGLHDEFLKLCRPEGEDIRVLDKDANVLLDHKVESKAGSTSSYKPEIDRGDLRSLILNAIDPQSIKWGHKLVNILTEDSSAEYTLTFSDSTLPYAKADIIIGADGAWSRVRSLFLATNHEHDRCDPSYSGVSFIETAYTDYATIHPHLAEVAGRGSTFAVGDHKGFIAQQNARGVLRAYLALTVPEEWSSTSDIAQGTEEEQKKLLLEDMRYYKGWNEQLLNFIRDADDGSMVIRAVYSLPLPFISNAWVWPSAANRVTLLGDAAHLMSPFAGEGVNLAMLDASELAQSILSIQSKPEIPKALRKYESRMKRRAHSAAKESARNLNVFFGENAAHELADVFAALSSYSGMVRFIMKMIYRRTVGQLWRWLGWI